MRSPSPPHGVAAIARVDVDAPNPKAGVLLDGGLEPVAVEGIAVKRFDVQDDLPARFPPSAVRKKRPFPDHVRAKARRLSAIPPGPVRSGDRERRSLMTSRRRGRWSRRRKRGWGPNHSASSGWAQIKRDPL